MRATGETVLAVLLLLALPGVAWAADGTVCDVQHSGMRPIMETHTLPPYPPMSVMTDEHGTTLLAVTIGSDGKPTDVQMAETSGSLRLDEAARDHVKNSWRWTPPGNGCAETKTRVSIKWDLRDAQRPGGFFNMDPARALNMMSVVLSDDADYPAELLASGNTSARITMVAVILSETGSTDVAMIRSGGVPLLDEKALQIARTRYHWTPAQMNGKPVGGAIFLVTLWMPPGQKKPDPTEFKTLIGMFMGGAAAPQKPPVPPAPMPPPMMPVAPPVLPK